MTSSKFLHTPHLSLLLVLLAALLLSGCASSRYVEGMYSPAVSGVYAPTTGSSIVTPTKPSVIVPTVPSPYAGNSADVKRRAVVATAKKYLGCKYKSAASGPKRFDCSGLTYCVYKQYGVELNRSSSQQFEQGIPVKSTRQLLPGDLVFWRGSNAKNPSVGHVGIVVEADSRTGRFTFIHAAMTGVQIDDSESDYYTLRYIGARRMF